MTPEQRALLEQMATGRWGGTDETNGAIRAALTELDELRASWRGADMQLRECQERAVGLKATLQTSSNINRQHLERIAVIKADLATAREALEESNRLHQHEEGWPSACRAITEAALAKMVKP